MTKSLPTPEISSEQQLQFQLLAPAFANDCANYMLILEGLYQAMGEASKEGRQEDLRDLMRRMGAQIDLLSNLLRGFLGRETDLRPAKVSSVVNTNVELFNQLGEAQGVLFQASDLSHLDETEVPKLDFSRILINLFNNALQACLAAPRDLRIVQVELSASTDRQLLISNPCYCDSVCLAEQDHIGLASIEETCTKMGLEIGYQQEAGRFKVELTFP